MTAIASSTVPELLGAKVSADQILVIWNPVSGATRYAVYRKVMGGSWTQLTASVTDTYYWDDSPDLVDGTTYYYTVRAYVGGAWSGYNNSGVYTTFKAPSNMLYFPFYLYSYDGKVFLGKLVTDKYDSDSIWNEYGTYGSEYSSTSIWNEYGKYGSDYSNESAFNEYATKPPQIVDYYGTFVAYLTENTQIRNGITLVQLTQLLKNYNQ